MAETIQEGLNGLTDLTIDEIFTRNSVHAVKNLHREYHASVNKAKADLHSLVGRKYRDLIQIAEDIDKMNGMSKSIDDKLTNLSYRTPNHVLFGNNTFAKFDTKLREENAKKARIASKHTIFNSIVNNQLLSFDLKLQGSAKISSRQLVHMAKVYFTIESVFQTKRADADITSNSLGKYRERFNSYLENKLASQLPNLPSSDKLKTTIISSFDPKWLESDAFDNLDGSLEDDQEDFSDDEEFVEAGTKKYFGGSSSSMSNYIVAYIILNESDEKLQSLEQVARKIISLRFAYLKGLLKSALERNTGKSCNINFSFIIAFTESTYSYVKKYFLDTDSSHVVASLHRSSTWKASDSIGFHNWFEADDVVFDTQKYSPLHADFLHSPESKNHSFVDYLIKIFMEIANNSNDIDPLKQADRVMSLLHNFVAACRKAEVTAELNENPCFTMELFTWSDLPHKLLNFVVSFIENILSKEKDFIGETLSNQIKMNLNDVLNTDGGILDLFEKDVINLIDEDFEEYFGQVLALSSSEINTAGRGAGSDACENLKQWFCEQKSLLALILTTEPCLVTDMIQALNKSYSSVKPFQLWGTFDTKSCQTSFLELSVKRKDSLKAEIEKLLDDVFLILKSFTADPDMKKLHYILKIVHLLKKNSPLYSDSRLVSRTDDALHDIFQRIFDALQMQRSPNLKTPILNLLAQSLVQAATSDIGTVPLSPHLVVNSSIEQISAAILSSSYLSSSELFDIFLCEENKALFVKVKNSFISKTLIQEGMIEGAKSGLCPQTIPGIPDKPENIETTKKTDFIGDNENAEITEVTEVTKNTPENKEAHNAHNLEDPENNENVKDTEISENVTDAENSEDSEDFFNSGINNESNEDAKPNVAEIAISEKSIDTDISPVVEADNETPAWTSKLLKSQSRQLMANIAFVLCFVSDLPLTVHNEEIGAYTKQVDDLSIEKIEESTLEIIIRGTNEFYKSSRNIYLPLLLN